MQIKDYLTPYPILYKYNNDYKSSVFDVDIMAEMDFRTVKIQTEFKLTNEEILTLIAEEKACYLLHVECPSTSYRVVYESFKPRIDVALTHDNIRDVVEVCSFIVLKEDIQNYKNENFNRDYEGYTFNLDAGLRIAVGDAKKFMIKTETDDLENLPSIIRVSKNEEGSGDLMSVETWASDVIHVRLSPQYFDLYCSMGKSQYKNSIISMIFLPAILTVLNKMKYEEEEHADKKWYQVIASLLEENNIHIEELDTPSQPTLTVAQKILSFPVGRGLDELKMKFGGDETNDA